MAKIVIVNIAIRGIFMSSFAMAVFVLHCCKCIIIYSLFTLLFLSGKVVICESIAVVFSIPIFALIVENISEVL